MDSKTKEFYSRLGLPTEEEAIDPDVLVALAVAEAIDGMVSEDDFQFIMHTLIAALRTRRGQ